MYQAFSPEIADAALKASKFTPPHFKFDRMTWIKFSFLWMMYRSNWASRRNQQRGLGIDIQRRGFERVLANSCLSHYEKRIYRDEGHWQTLLRSLPVRIQWEVGRRASLAIDVGYRRGVMAYVSLHRPGKDRLWYSNLQEGKAVEISWLGNDAPRVLESEEIYVRRSDRA